MTYEDLVDFWAKFDPYEMNTLLVGNDVMVKMLKLEGVPEPAHWAELPGAPAGCPPLGASLLRTSAMPAGTIIGLDRRFALEMVQGSDVLVEYDKLIDRAAGAGGHHHYQRLRQAVPGRGPGAGAVMEEQILAFVELMGGRGNEELLRPLCQAAEREMAGRLRRGCPRGMRARLPGGRSLAGAGRTGGRDGRRDFLSAGDLTVHTGGDGAGAMRRQAERLMAPIWRTDLPFGGAGVRVDTISALLDRYGQCVTLYRGGVEAGREVRAFLQPCRGGGGNRPAPPPGAAAGGPVSDAGGAGRPGGPRGPGGVAGERI